MGAPCGSWWGPAPVKTGPCSDLFPPWRPKSPAKHHARDKPERVIGRHGVAHALDLGRALDPDHRFAELQPQRDLGERPVTVADGDQAQRRPRDEGVAGLADAGGKRNRDM